MIAVIKGDIIESRKLGNPEKWLIPLKETLNKWGSTPAQWELIWGDFFQIEIADPLDALRIVFEIRTMLKSLTPQKENTTINNIDVRMAIGIGTKDYAGHKVSESNGTAFVFAGEKFERLKKEKLTFAIQSPWDDFDAKMNLYLRLVNIFMERWSVSSAELMQAVCQNPGASQQQLGTLLHIKQNSVSGRWARAHIDEIIEVENMYRHLLNQQLIC